MTLDIFDIVSANCLVVLKCPVMYGAVVQLRGCILCLCFGEDGICGGVGKIFESPFDVLFSVHTNRT